MRVGTQREASSGCYTAMALCPLTAAGEALTRRLARRLARDARWLMAQTGLTLPLTPLVAAGPDEADLRELDGFAHHARPYDSACPALLRFLTCRRTSALPPLLAQLLQVQGDLARLPPRGHQRTAGPDRRPAPGAGRRADDDGVTPSAHPAGRRADSVAFLLAQQAYSRKQEHPHE